MTNKKKTKVRAKYSILCLKRAKLIDGIVFVKEHNIWALVKGKEYVDGHFKYVYNGHEGVVPYAAVLGKDGCLTKKVLKNEVIKMNMNHLMVQFRIPKRKLKARWEPELDLDLLLRPAAPVVEMEQEN